MELLNPCGDPADTDPCASPRNDYFASILTVEDLQNISEMQWREFYVMEPVSMTVDCIVELIENLKLSSSASFDNINLKILKNTKLISFELLRMIFQHTLFKGSLPRDWKIAKIIPIHKRGDQRHISNCRSIELVFHQRFSTVYFLHTLQIP